MHVKVTWLGTQVTPARKRTLLSFFFSWGISGGCAQYNSQHFLWKNYLGCKLKFRKRPTTRNYIGQLWVVTKWFLLLNSFNCSIMVQILSVKCSTETIAFQSFWSFLIFPGTTLETKNLQTRRSPALPSTGIEMTPEKSAPPTPGEISRKKKKQQVSTRTLLLESIWWYYGSFW